MTHQDRREFFESYSLLVEEQRKQEENLERIEYVEGLKQVEDGLNEIVEGEIECWRICKPYTKIKRED